jgi:RNA polymerase sigma-70 factor, ECF subfamily
MSVGNKCIIRESFAPSGVGLARRCAFESARKEWPDVVLDFGSFCEHLDALGYTDALPKYVNSVYLCAGCALGVPAAHLALERTFFPMLRASVRRLMAERASVEDTLQEVRYRLLVGASRRILTYRGSGPLGSWLRVIAVNVAMDERRAHAAHTRRRRLHEQMTRGASHYPLDKGSPEDGILRRSSIGRCERALRAGIASLGSSDRQLLYSYFVLGLNIDQLGTIHGRNRSTMARRIRRTLKHVRDRVRVELRSNGPGASRHDMEGIASVMYNEIDLSAATLILPATTASAVM